MAISISSLSISEDLIYNQRPGSGANGNSTANGFHVGTDGNIFIHNLGKVKAAGMTRDELKYSLEKALSPFLKDPLVTVLFSNHHVTILGEITNPQPVPLSGRAVNHR